MNESITLNLGIDLGTTNSAAALISVRNGKLVSTPLRIERFTDVNSQGGCRRERRELLPSCVTYFPVSGQYQPIVGDAAKKISYTRPFAVAKSVKSQMGQEKLSYVDWNPDYPDQTPQAVSGRIIRHILNQVRDMYHEEIDRAIITVPASFGVAQKRATLMAAESAGLKVRNASGEYNDDLLLPEPEAVMYAVLNQHANGELNIPCDFSTPKLVMVYDIGGGTLDITLHSVRTDPNDPNAFEIKAIATNRFSQVAGNAIDKCIAEWMWLQYLNDLESVDHDVVRRVTDKKAQCMAYMLRYAEELKENFSDRYYQSAEMGRELPMDAYINYGGEMPVGYDLESDMTRAQFEDCLRPLMGENLTFEDYKRFDQLDAYEHTILYPVLDVLAKGAQKLGTQNLKIDMVILNGGMSRLPLIGQRLERFFGFPMTSVSDPDKTVAQGAAIYSYYHNFAPESEPQSQPLSEQKSASPSPPRMFHDITEPEVDQKIRSLGAVLNETVYLGLKGGAVMTLAEAGCDLPFVSKILSGFRMAPGVDRIDIPIKEKRGNDTYVTVARGRIDCGREHRNEEAVAIQFTISRSGILSLSARLEGGIRPVGKVDILLGGEDESIARKKKLRTLHPPAGTVLVPANTISSLKDLLTRYEREKSKKNITLKIQQKKTEILSCGNPADFAEGLLKLLEESYKPHMVMNVLPLARKLSGHWSETQRAKLANFCLMWLAPDLNAYGASGKRVSANIEAIMTLGVCGTTQDCRKLDPLMSRPSYESALLYAFGYAGIHMEWIIDVFYRSVDTGKPVQDSLQALGIAFYNQNEIASGQDLVNVADEIMHMLEGGGIPSNVFNLAMVTLGILCRQGSDAQIPENVRQDAIDITRQVNKWYDTDTLSKAQKAISIARNLMNGAQLGDEDERYLLRLLEH